MISKIIRCSNSEVTDHFLNVIGNAANRVKSDKKVTISASFEQTIKAHLRGEKVIFWVQGIPAEESYMRHHSTVRSGIISFIERKALRSSDFVIFCSDYMKEHYERKFNMRFDISKHYVMPCYNTKLNADNFMTQGKYEDNVFVYIGSLSIWQRFEDTLLAYRNISRILADSRLIIYTQEMEEAHRLLEKHSISNAQVDYVPNDRLASCLSGIKFGFVLREDNEVNRVSTPTKISTYLANGIIPIYSKCLKSFAKQASKMKYVVEESDMIERIIDLNNSRIDSNDVLQEFNQLFSNYYSDVYHEEDLFNLISRIQLTW